MDLTGIRIMNLRNPLLQLSVFFSSMIWSVRKAEKKVNVEYKRKKVKGVSKLGSEKIESMKEERNMTLVEGLIISIAGGILG